MGSGLAPRRAPKRAKVNGLEMTVSKVREKPCGACAHFRNEPAYLEAALAGLTSLGSAYGSVRADDGLCLLHDRYLRAHASCADFAARSAPCVAAATGPENSAAGGPPLL